MYKSILDTLACPTCKDTLTLSSSKESNGEIIEGTLCCSNNHQWKISDGIIDFNSTEQDFGNNWSEMYEKYDFDELDKLIMADVPDIEKQSNHVGINELIATLESSNSQTVLDIATGRGMLLKRLVSHFGENINLTCIDLSFEVLKYDRLKALRINPNVKINYIACDASNIPLKDKSFDSSVSFSGIGNMGDLAQKGISEALRVTDGPLFNCSIVIKDDNPKLESIKTELKAAGHNLPLDFCKESFFLDAHKLSKNTKVDVKTVFEGIASKNKNDLIPIEGEWFGMAIATVTEN